MDAEAAEVNKSLDDKKSKQRRKRQKKEWPEDPENETTDHNILESGRSGPICTPDLLNSNQFEEEGVNSVTKLDTVKIETQFEEKLNGNLENADFRPEKEKQKLANRDHRKKRNVSESVKNSLESFNEDGKSHSNIQESSLKEVKDIKVTIIDESSEKSKEIELNTSANNLEKVTKMEEITPSSHLGVIKNDALDPVVKEEEKHPQTLQSSPSRALNVRRRKKLLILDLNGLLVDIVPYVPHGCEPDIMIGRKSVFKRPFCDDFLQFCFERFDVGVWSSRTKRNVDDVIDFLMGDNKSKLLFCWDQSHCTDTGFNTIENQNKPLLLKEVKKLWEKHDQNLPWQKGDYNESNTLLLDDSPYKALRNPPYTAIFPYTYQYVDKKDRSLGRGGDLRVYLEGLAMANNVQKYVQHYPFGQRAITKSNLSWRFYLRVIGRDS